MQSSRRRTRRLASVVVSILAVVTMSATLTACGSKPTVLVYGDSLAWESQDQVKFWAGGNVDTFVEAYGGTALCDYAQAAVDKAQSWKPQLVVFSFSGNALTECMRRYVSSPNGIAAKYRADADWVASQLAPLGISVAFVTAPPALDCKPGATRKLASRADGVVPDGCANATHPLTAVYSDVASSWQAKGFDVVTIDGAKMLRSATGGWTKVAPCLPWEGAAQGCRDGLIDVRAADLNHFCPQVATSAAGVVAECGTYSSGAVRYGQTIGSWIQWRTANRMLGSVDALSGGAGKIRVAGWVADVDGDTRPTQVHIYVDGRGMAVTADQARPDVAAVYGEAGPNHGFDTTITASRGTHDVCVYGINAFGADKGNNVAMMCRKVTV